MKIKVETSSLLSILKRGLTFIPKKPSYPALSCFYFQVENNVIKATAFDGERSYHAQCGCISDVTTSFAVDGKLLTDTLFLTNHPTLDIELTQGLCTIKSGKAKYKLVAHDDYPVVEEKAKAFEITLGAQEFKNVISRSLVFCDPSSPRPSFCGIHISAKGSDVWIETVHQFMFSQVKIEPRSMSSWESIVVHHGTMKAVNDILDDKEIITIAHNKKQISFKFSGITINSVLIDDKFPDVTPILAKVTKTSYFKFNKEEMELALKKIKIYSKSEIPFEATFTTKDKEVHIMGSDHFGGNEANEVVDMTENYGCDDMTVTAKADQLLAITQSISDSEGVCYITSEKDPMLFRNSNINDRTFLVMPLKKL